MGEPVSLEIHVISELLAAAAVAKETGEADSFLKLGKSSALNTVDVDV